MALAANWLTVGDIAGCDVPVDWVVESSCLAQEQFLISLAAVATRHKLLRTGIDSHADHEFWTRLITKGNRLAPRVQHEHASVQFCGIDSRAL